MITEQTKTRFLASTARTIAEQIVQTMTPLPEEHFNLLLKMARGRGQFVALSKQNGRKEVLDLMLPDRPDKALRSIREQNPWLNRIIEIKRGFYGGHRFSVPCQIVEQVTR